jgi:hypothetical protein
LYFNKADVPRSHNGTLFGYFQSKREINGRDVYKGPLGGIYYFTASGNKRYLNQNEIEEKVVKVDDLI